MFTGLISAVGQVVKAEAGGTTIGCPEGWLSDVHVGDSIAVDGACLTAVSVDGSQFSVQVSEETLSRCAPLDLDQQVNLEKALVASDRIGGHFVTGHVDGLAHVVEKIPTADGGTDLRLTPPQELLPLLVEKGSVALAGISLTINRVNRGDFSVHLVPHTLAQTTLGNCSIGSALNIEADLLARHITRWHAFHSEP